MLDITRELTSIHETLRDLKKRGEDLSTRVDELEEKRGLVPRDVKLRDESREGLVGTNPEAQPYCPTCQADDVWCSLPRERTTQGRVFCQRCKKHHICPPPWRAGST